MRQCIALVPTIVVMAAQSAFAAAAPTEGSVHMTAAECEVWNRELSFAHSVQAHDAAAFAEHVLPGTVFSAATAHPTRGRAAVLAEWQDIIAGKGFVLRWHPGFVSIGGDPNIALSSGPAWTEDLRSGAKSRRTISRFTSTWVRDTDGKWRVLFDGAGSPPQPASADEVKKLVASRSPTCPMQ